MIVILINVDQNLLCLPDIENTNNNNNNHNNEQLCPGSTKRHKSNNEPDPYELKSWTADDQIKSITSLNKFTDKVQDTIKNTMVRDGLQLFTRTT